MGHKFLLAIEESENSLRIAEYLKTLLDAEDRVTLFSVLPNPAILYNFNDPSVSPIFLENKDFFSEFNKVKKDTMLKIFEKIKRIIIKSGLDKSKIDMKLEIQNETIAHHIVNEAIKGKYNTIVMGKHSSMRLKELILGDVTIKVIHLSKDIPVIVV